MAEKIVGFSIEIKGQKEILNTTKLLGLLNTQLILINNTLVEINKNSSVSLGGLTKDMKKAGDSTQQLGAVVRTSMRAFDEGNKTVQNLGNGYFEVTREVEKTAKGIKNLTKEELIQLEIEKDIARENKQIAKQQAIIQRANKDNIASLRAQLSLATIEWKKYTVEELKSTDAGRKAAAEKLRLTNALVKEEKATGDARRQVGFYENATKSLGKTLLRLSVGRDVIRGLFGAFVKLLDQSKGTNDAAKSIIDSFDRLKSAAIKFGLAVINVVARPLNSLINGAEAVAKALFGIDFSAAKASDGVRDLQNSFNSEIETLKRGNLSTEARKQLITDINTKYKEYLPNLLSENASLEEITTAQNAANKAFEKKILLLASEEQFIDITKRRLDALREEARLQSELTAATKKAGESSSVLKAQAGLSAEDRKIAALAQVAVASVVTGIENRIEANKKAIAQIEQEKKALNDVIKSEGINTADFVSNQKVKTEAELEQIEKSKSAKKEALEAEKEAEKKRAEELKTDRAEALKDLQTNSQARIDMISELSKDIIQAEITAITDQTQQALAAERNRYALEKQARHDNFQSAVDEAVQQEAKIQALFGDGSQELADFQEKTGEELLMIQSKTNELSEQEAKNHQDNLAKITKDGNDRQKEADKEAAKARVEIQKVSLKNIGEAVKKGLDKTKEAIDKSIEQAKETANATKDAIVEVINTAFNAVSTITDIANEAENQRFEDAINRREASISALNEDMQNATGLQKKFLEQQLKQENAALKKETEQKEKAQREQAETQKGIAITQALINGALGVTGIWAGVISGNPVVDAIIKGVLTAALVVNTAVQVAAISAQKYAKGGVLQGKSHAEGGIPASVGGSSVELEGGEAVINKRSTAMYRPLLSQINSAGGGVAFASGGVLNAPMAAPRLGNSQTDLNTMFSDFTNASLAMVAATNRRIDRLTVVQDLNNLQDIQKNDARLQALTTLK